MRGRHTFLLIAIAAVLASAPVLAQEKRSTAPESRQADGGLRGRESFKQCWFPFPAGTSATCAQGPFGSGTHRDGYYWDFVLKEGTPILAPTDGRVILVVDDRTATGIRPTGSSPQEIAKYQETSMANANQLAIDHGDGTCSWFWHHKAGTARIRPGDIVATGMHIADVGMSGTYIAHICFSVRSPAETANRGTFDVHFWSQGGQTVEVKTGQLCLSQTMEPKEQPRDFRESMLQGNEFAANGVTIQSKQSLFFLPAGKRLIYEGRITQPAVTVGFYLWKPGRTSEIVKTVAPDADGHFRINVHIPQSSRGNRWYAIAIKKPDGSVTTPARSVVFVY
jgi:murein DD-endopeptidase MepM/ murein hydrolase activator NlpD